MKSEKGIKELKYSVVDKSMSLHDCCFSFTVVESYSKKPICETMEKKDALLICDALNYCWNYTNLKFL
jgi:hypothetical protein